MSIDRLLKHHEALLVQVAKAAKAPAADIEIVRGALEVDDRRVDAVRRRIGKLEQEKADQTARLDATIATLRAELAATDAAVKSRRTLLDPLVKTTAAKPASEAKSKVATAAKVTAAEKPATAAKANVTTAAKVAATAKVAGTAKVSTQSPPKKR